MCVTIEGVDVIDLNTDYIVHTTVSGVKKCFITPNNNCCYYTVSGVSDWSLHRVDNVVSDWAFESIVCTTGSGFLSGATIINDIYITEDTSVNGSNNTVFISTDYGIYIYDEGSTDYKHYMTLE